MSRGVALWQGVLARQPGLVLELKRAARTASIDAGDGEASEAMEREAALVDDDPFAGFDDQFDDESIEVGANDDPFADFDPRFDHADMESNACTERNEHSVERHGAGVPISVVDLRFEESADLWLTRSHTGLEHALLSLGLTRDVLPTKRPLLIFGSRRTELRAPQYHRVAVCREGWPTGLHPTSRLAPTDAAKILASSQNASDSMMGSGFSGDTVAVEVPNPLVAEARWIAIWPYLDALPTEETGDRCPQWRNLRRVVWWVNKGQIGPRDTLDWLSRYWSEVPIRVALFGATFFLDDSRTDSPRSRILPKVRRALERFESLGARPWTVAGP